MKTNLLILVAAAVLIGGFCSGCAEKFTRQRYETLYIGQPMQEVQLTLGDTPYKASDTWTYQHEDPFYKAIIKFKDDKVTDKAWYDENEMGTNPDLKDKAGPGSMKSVTKTVP